MRKALGIICYFIALALNAWAGYYCYMTYTFKISQERGLLTFIPIFIATYWFATFFVQLTSGKDKNGKPHMNKILFGFLNKLLTIISIALLVFWVYFYFVMLKPTA